MGTLFFIVYFNILIFFKLEYYILFLKNNPLTFCGDANLVNLAYH